MSAAPPEPSAGDVGAAEAADRAELAATVEVLTEENRRLREEYVRARRRRYRRTALGLGLVGLGAGLAALGLPDARDVLLALAGTGLFAGVLVAYLTPERFVAATVADGVYEAVATNEAALVDALDLAGEPVYVPAPGGVRLFVPVHADARLPPAEALGDLFVVTDDPTAAGVSLRPSAAGLFEEVAAATGGDLADEPGRRADQLADALVEQFELVDAATPSVDPAAGRAAVEVEGSALGSIDRFDHPVASLLGVGLADCVDDPVRTTVEVTGPADVLIDCAWSPEATADAP